jgi:hypothetical protein
VLQKLLEKIRGPRKSYQVIVDGRRVHWSDNIKEAQTIFNWSCREPRAHCKMIQVKGHEKKLINDNREMWRVGQKYNEKSWADSEARVKAK